MPLHDNIWDFRAAAGHRLTDALELLETPSRNSRQPDAARRHLRGAMYLGGYAVECILKAYLIGMHHPLSTLSEVDARLRARNPNLPNLLSAEGHSIVRVLRLTDLEQHQTDAIRRQFGLVATVWSANMRYDRSAPERFSATDLVQSAQNLYDWVRARINSTI